MRSLFLLAKVKAKFLQILKRILRIFGLGVTSYANLLNLTNLSQNKSYQDFLFVRSLGDENQELILPLLSKSKSQLRQDLFVLNQLNFKKEGYFVEFGATNGLDLSNTYLLEKEYLWKGILAEPARVWEKDLYLNRPNAHIETMCVWKNSNSFLTFNEASAPELSTVDQFSYKDGHKYSRRSGNKYEVQTISLNDLLKKHNAPQYIDYLSIDTEGSEFDILSSFNFDYYSFRIITVEHNYTLQRDLIFSLLSEKGYIRKFESISNFDDWYVRTY